MELGGASFILMAVELAVRTLFTEDCFRHMQFYLQRQRLKGGEAKNGWPLAPLACGPTILKRLCFAPLLIGVFEFYTLLQVDKCFGGWESTGKCHSTPLWHLPSPLQEEEWRPMTLRCRRGDSAFDFEVCRKISTILGSGILDDFAIGGWDSFGVRGHCARCCELP